MTEETRCSFLSLTGLGWKEPADVLSLWRWRSLSFIAWTSTGRRCRIWREKELPNDLSLTWHVAYMSWLQRRSSTHFWFFPLSRLEVPLSHISHTAMATFLFWSSNCIHKLQAMVLPIKSHQGTSAPAEISMRCANVPLRSLVSDCEAHYSKLSLAKGERWKRQRLKGTERWTWEEHGWIRLVEDLIMISVANFKHWRIPMQCFTARWLHPRGSRIEQGHVLVTILG